VLRSPPTDESWLFTVVSCRSMLSSVCASVDVPVVELDPAAVAVVGGAAGGAVVAP